MPIPRLPATHHRKMVRNSAGQLKKKMDATAPTWKRTMKNVVIQLTPVDAFLPYISSSIYLKPLEEKCTSLTLPA